MIKKIDELKKKSLSFITDFINNCTIEEKIDTYYVSVEIRSKNNIVFIKSNGKAIDRSDLILNEMWQQLINDWVHFKMINQEWFEKHIGYKIYMFYFPCTKPILTEYNDNISYLIDRVEYGANVIYDFKDEMKDMQMIDKFNISFKTHLNKKYDIDAVIDKIKNANKNNISYNEIFQNIIDFNNSTIYAKNAPEGFIFKYGKKYIYQLLSDDSGQRIASAEKSQYEYLLLDFIKFWNTSKDIDNALEHNYIKTVCNLFNLYIAQEKETKVIETNINSDSLQSPCIGKRFDMCYTNIPDELTISLCKESELYKNIFKILLVNLKRTKNEEHCILFNKKSVDNWNNIVKSISYICV